jgi:hypothetical protein
LSCIANTINGKEVFPVFQNALYPGQVSVVPLEPRMAQLETLEAKVCAYTEHLALEGRIL